MHIWYLWKAGHLQEEGMKEPCLQMPWLTGQIYFLNIHKLLTFACVTLIITEFKTFLFLLSHLDFFCLLGNLF